MSTTALIIVRYLVAWACGWLVSHGWSIANLDGPTMDAVTSIAGGVLLASGMAFIGVWQSGVQRVIARLQARHKTELVAGAAEVPGVTQIQTTPAMASAIPSDKVVSAADVTVTGGKVMASLFAWLGSFLGGPFIKGALDAYKAKLANANNADQRTADLMARELAVEQREAEVRTDLLVAEQGHFETRMVRPLFALPFIVYNFKLIVWDKVLAWGVTDALSPDLVKVEMIVIGGYFTVRTAQALVSAFKR